MNKKMTIRHKFAYSFYDFSAYKEFLNQGLGKAIIYIFIVTIIFSTLANIKITSVFNDNISRFEYKFNKEAPDFEYKDGKLTMDYDGPIHYKYTGNSEMLSFFINDLLINGNLIIDTSGKTDISVLDSYMTGTYINSDTISIKSDNNEITTLALKDYLKINTIDCSIITINKPFTIDCSIINKALVSDSFSVFKNIFDFTIFIVKPIIDFLSNLCAAFLVLASLTIIISKNLNMSLSYKNACTISLYAMTMPLLIESLSTVSGLFIPDYNIVFYVIALLYCLLALKNINKSNNKKINALL